MIAKNKLKGKKWFYLIIVLNKNNVMNIALDT